MSARTLKFVTFDGADPERLSRFWSEVTGYLAVGVGEDFAALAAPDDRGVRGILLWRLPEPNVSNRRMHIDLTSTDGEAEIRRFVDLGATMSERCEGNGVTWTVMLDPEGNEFCMG